MAALPLIQVAQTVYNGWKTCNTTKAAAQIYSAGQTLYNMYEVCDGMQKWSDARSAKKYAGTRYHDPLMEDRYGRTRY